MLYCTADDPAAQESEDEIDPNDVEEGEEGEEGDAQEAEPEEVRVGGEREAEGGRRA